MKNPFKSEVTHDIYHVVEVPVGTKLPELTGDLKETLRALQFNPAFNYLIQRLRLQRSGVQNALQDGMNLTEVQLRYLQAAMYWLGYLEKDIASLTQVSASIPRPALDNEAELFAKVQQNLDLVGLN